MKMVSDSVQQEKQLQHVWMEQTKLKYLTKKISFSLQQPCVFVVVVAKMHLERAARDYNKWEMGLSEPILHFGSLTFSGLIIKLDHSISM